MGPPAASEEGARVGACQENKGRTRKTNNAQTGSLACFVEQAVGERSFFSSPFPLSKSCPPFLLSSKSSAVTILRFACRFPFPFPSLTLTQTYYLTSLLVTWEASVGAAVVGASVVVVAEVGAAVVGGSGVVVVGAGTEATVVGPEVGEGVVRDGGGGGTPGGRVTMVVGASVGAAVVMASGTTPVVVGELVGA